LKIYLEDLEKQGKFKIIYYKDRLKYFPNDEEKVIKNSATIILRFGKKGEEKIKNSLPRTYKKALELIDKGFKLEKEDVVKYGKK